MVRATAGLQWLDALEQALVRARAEDKLVYLDAFHPG
jgi:hypothetical protein